MNYHRFELIKSGDNPIIRITYKNWRGRLVNKDVCRSSSLEGYWIYMESGNLIVNSEPIEVFFKNDFADYLINGLTS